VRPDRKKAVLVAVDLLVVLALAGTVTHVVLSRRQTTKDATTCAGTARTHKLQLENGQFSQPQLTVARCDTVTIMNSDKQAYLLNFGDYDRHQDYPGFTPQVQVQHEAVAFTALQKGKYELHDHIGNNAHLALTVESKR